MNELLESALNTDNETAFIEFKEGFDTSSAQEWCEIIKDIVAIANTGEGVIIFGLNDNGTPSGKDVTPILALDSADVIDKIHKYTNRQFAEFTIKHCEKLGNTLAALIIKKVPIPLVFEKPGTYDAGGGKQKTAFGMGTVYFRHGAKSEPGNTDDLRESFEKLIAEVRESWLKNVRQVIEAPLGSTVVTIRPGDDPAALPVRITNDPNAPVIGGISPDRTHPFRQKELIEAVNQKLPPDRHINQYDVQCIRKLYDIENDVTFHYLPKFGGHQYSPTFADWVIERFNTDNSFFEKARMNMREVKKKRS